MKNCLGEEIKEEIRDQVRLLLLINEDFDLEVSFLKESKIKTMRKKFLFWNFDVADKEHLKRTEEKISTLIEVQNKVLDYANCLTEDNKLK